MFMLVWLSVGLCTHVSCLQKLEERVGATGAGVTGSCEQPEVDVGMLAWVLS